jgi:ABC-type glycerol-3-phosphate transport system permease component
MSTTISTELSSSSGFFRRKSTLRNVNLTVAYVLAIGGAIIMFIPILWAIFTGLKDLQEIMAYPPTIFPKVIHWENFIFAFSKTDLHLSMINSIIIGAFCVLGQLISGSLAAFAFSRIKYPGREVLFVIVLSMMMIPFSVVMIPRFVIFRQFKWIDTWLPLIVPWLFGGYPYFIFLLRQYFLTIPAELDDAALIDGCSTFGIYSRIILPLTKPGLATVAIFTFRHTWRDLLGPLVFLKSERLWTVSLRLADLNPSTVHGSDLPFSVILMAAVLSIIPVVLLFLSFQRLFIQGIVISGVKE